MATAIGKKAKCTITWQWPTAAGGWTALSTSCQVSWPGGGDAHEWLALRYRGAGLLHPSLDLVGGKRGVGESERGQKAD